MINNVKQDIYHQITSEYTDNIESGLRLVDFEHQVKLLEVKLKKLGLETFRADVLIDRFVSGLSLEEIAKKYGFVEHKAVSRLITNTLQLINKINPDVIRKL